MHALLSVILLFLSAPILAQVTLDHDDFSITSRAQMWLDDSGEVGINDILVGSATPNWQANERGELSYGFRSEALWMRWAVQRGPEAPGRWFYVPEYEMLDSVEVFLVDDKGLF